VSEFNGRGREKHEDDLGCTHMNSELTVKKNVAKCLHRKAPKTSLEVGKHEAPPYLVKKERRGATVKRKKKTGQSTEVEIRSVKFGRQ